MGRRAQSDTRLGFVLVGLLALMSAVALSSILRLGQRTPAAPGSAGVHGLTMDTRAPYATADGKAARQVMAAPLRFDNGGSADRFMGMRKARAPGLADGSAGHGGPAAPQGVVLLVLLAGLGAGWLLSRGLLAQLCAEPANNAAAANTAANTATNTAGTKAASRHRQHLYYIDSRQGARPNLLRAVRRMGKSALAGVQAAAVSLSAR